MKEKRKKKNRPAQKNRPIRFPWLWKSYMEQRSLVALGQNKKSVKVYFLRSDIQIIYN